MLFTKEFVIFMDKSDKILVFNPSKLHYPWIPTISWPSWNKCN